MTKPKKHFEGATPKALARALLRQTDKGEGAKSPSPNKPSSALNDSGRRLDKR